MSKYCRGAPRLLDFNPAALCSERFLLSVVAISISLVVRVEDDTAWKEKAAVSNESQ